ncbi:ATP-binding protein [Actinacidiphila bryophytorum]|uniref:ATP-binding protein n=1 Tax=Actinacidiphila bryophytorum TaxID=1436133 RepID=UPI002176D39A|nr:ATP-binding protein [Actinacidiphila bryophytorum]UWE10228.1 ATP-binding protein [Actinacidiphila bryophytorum]
MITGSTANGSGRARLRGLLTASTSAAGVENVLALAYGGARIATILQMIPSLPRGMKVSQEPHLYLVLWLLAAANAVVVVTFALVRKRGLSPAGVVVDVALCVAFLLLGTLAVPVPDRIGSWVGWAPGYALAVVMGLVGLRAGAWCAAVGAVSAAYMYFVAGAVTAANRSTIAGNTLTLIVLGVVARVVVRYMRHVAADADRAHARVAELARREEEQRARLTMHNATTIMHLLIDPAVPPDTRDQLREQAAAEVRRMRAYLSRGPDTRSPCAPGDRDPARPAQLALREVLEAGMSGFADLGLEPAVDLADGVMVGADTGEAIRDAVAGVLHNVRRHARATMVIVHADAEEDCGRWIVTIRDDGVGFDTATTPLGTGLAQQVVAELRRHCLTVTISSAPGLGTQVTIEGKLAR